MGCGSSARYHDPESTAQLLAKDIPSASEGPTSPTPGEAEKNVSVSTIPDTTVRAQQHQYVGFREAEHVGFREVNFPKQSSGHAPAAVGFLDAESAGVPKISVSAPEKSSVSDKCLSDHGLVERTAEAKHKLDLFVERRSARLKKKNAKKKSDKFLSSVPDVALDIQYRFRIFVVGDLARDLIEAACTSSSSQESGMKDPNASSPVRFSSDSRFGSEDSDEASPRLQRMGCNWEDSLQRQHSPQRQLTGEDSVGESSPRLQRMGCNWEDSLQRQHSPQRQRTGEDSVGESGMVDVQATGNGSCNTLSSSEQRQHLPQCQSTGEDSAGEIGMVNVQATGSGSACSTMASSEQSTQQQGSPPHNDGSSHSSPAQPPTASKPVRNRCISPVPYPPQAIGPSPKHAKLMFEALGFNKAIPTCQSSQDASSTALVFCIIVDPAASATSLEVQLCSLQEVLEECRGRKRRYRPSLAVLLCHQHGGKENEPDDLEPWSLEILEFERTHGALWKFGAVGCQNGEMLYSVFAKIASQSIYAAEHPAPRRICETNLSSEHKSESGESDGQESPCISRQESNPAVWAAEHSETPSSVVE